ncbi:MAG: nuclear transport factor 2 family protein [Dehalococcoidia bacterium]
MATTLQQLIDERDITALMVRYADRIDAKDPEGSAACFAPDGVGVYWGEYRGRAAIADRLRGILDDFHATSHHLSNVMIDLDGDRATAQAYVYAFHRVKPSNEAMHYWGRWVDELVRVDGEWLFARREVVGIGSINRGNPDRDLQHPGHPGRLP